MAAVCFLEGKPLRFLASLLSPRFLSSVYEIPMVGPHRLQLGFPYQESLQLSRHQVLAFVGDQVTKPSNSTAVVLKTFYHC